MFDADIGLIALDQEKVFVRVDHNYLFIIYLLAAFGFGQNFIKWIQLLFIGVSCMVKVVGGLSRAILVSRGIRQGCPLSGQLYSIAIEPLLFIIRKTLTGLSIPTVPQHSRAIITAYADVTVFVNDNNDIKALSRLLDLYERASSEKVNWDKIEAFWSGQRNLEKAPTTTRKLKLE